LGAFHHVFGEALQVSQSDDNYFIVLSSRRSSTRSEKLAEEDGVGVEKGGEEGGG